MKCPNCNRENEAASRFCIHCGAPLPESSCGAGMSEELAAQVVVWMNTKSRKWVIKELVKKHGLTQEAAEQLINQVQYEIEEYKKSPEGRREMAKQGRNKMISGLIWTVAGLAITIGTFVGASEGGVFFIAWGAVLWGIVDFFMGLTQWLKYRGAPASGLVDYQASPSVPRAPVAVPPVAPSRQVAAASAAVRPAVMARLILPDKSEVTLVGEERDLGRDDFKQAISSTSASYISRRHLRIKSQEGHYYIEDAGSANGTRLNGINIKGSGRRELSDGDHINLADVAEVVFKMSPA